MEQLTRSDLLLVQDLSKRIYSGNTILSNASESEKTKLSIIKKKLKSMADYYSTKYNDTYGPFLTSVVTGNDIGITGTQLKRIWSTLYKGAENKQYAAQISFGIDPGLGCFDVSFCFGDAAGRNMDKNKKELLEIQLQTLGTSLASSLEHHADFLKKFNDLFDFGFYAYANHEIVNSNIWIASIKNNAKSSGIIGKIYPNDFGVIEYSTIDSFVSQIIFLMGGISNTKESIIPNIKPITAEQRAKQAERLAEIGAKGEIYVFNCEKEKIKSLGLNSEDYPKHLSLISPLYGYDILSLDDNSNEIFIEVKTTTRKEDDPNSKMFYISSNEYNTYQKNKLKYKLSLVSKINPPTI
jgi:hypothetical protein